MYYVKAFRPCKTKPFQHWDYVIKKVSNYGNNTSSVESLNLPFSCGQPMLTVITTLSIFFHSFKRFQDIKHVRFTFLPTEPTASSCNLILHYSGSFVPLSHMKMSLVHSMNKSTKRNIWTLVAFCSGNNITFLQSLFSPVTTF